MFLLLGWDPVDLDEGVEGRGYGDGDGLYVDSMIEEGRRRTKRLEIEGS